MAIKNLIGNAQSAIGHAVGGALSELSSKLQGALSGATARLTSLWDGGFVGLDASNMTTLTTDIESYVGALMEISDNFAKTNDISGALKGEAAAATQEYVSAVASLIDAYCTSYRNFNKMAAAATEAMQSGDTDNAAAIRDDAQSIMQDASSIRVD